MAPQVQLQKDLYEFYIDFVPLAESPPLIRWTHPFLKYRFSLTLKRML